MKKKIIVVHPGKQHSYRLAEALKKENMLMSYVTTVYNKKYSWTNFLGQFLKGDNKKRFLTRKTDVFEENVVQFCELRGLLLLLLYRKKPNSNITIWLEKHVHRMVYIKTIKLAKKKKADAIVFYGGLREEHFKLKEKICPDIKFIIDVPTATDQYIQKVLEKDIEITGDEYTKIEQSSTWNAGNNLKVPVRNILADGFLVGSSFVKKSLVDFKADERKIKIVPYGVDTSRFTIKKFDYPNKKVKFIFVGRVNRRKGIQHLLPAFKRLDTEKAELLLVGQYNENDSLIQEYETLSNIKFKGFVTQDIVAKLYKEADVFVLPSLGEGLAQVGIEAMSSGLPIIVSDNAGVNDLIKDGKEGFVVPTSDTNKLYETMNWFVENKEMIPSMGKQAYETAQKYTWDYYGKNAVKAINEILGE